MKNNSKSVWNVKEKLFPKKGSLQQKIKYLVRYGILAPSGHNSQPWIFEISDNRLAIKPDYDRVRPTVDPYNRELFISLGAAAKNVEIAAAYFGMIFEKKYEGEEIVFKFWEGEKLGDRKELFGAITKRFTSRNEFEKKEVRAEVKDKIKKIRAETTTLRIVEQGEKERVARLVHDSVLVWYKSKELMTELEGWLRDDVEGSKDGLPVGVLSMYKLASELKYMLSKNDEVAIKKAKRDSELALGAPMLIVVSAKTDNVWGWVESGETYQETALELVSGGLQNGFFNTVLELGGQRAKLGRLLKIKGKPQLLLRAGYGIDKERHTPRRPISEVIRVVK